MALTKIQSFVQKLSESENVKKVLGDIQKLSTELQQKVQTLKTDEAVKKYKDIVKKATQAEGELEKEVNKVIVKIKKSANDVKSDLMVYKKKALQKKSELEKLLKNTKDVTVTASAATKTKTKKAKKATKRAATKKKSTSKK